MPPPTTAVTTTTNRHDRRALAWAGESEHGPEAGQLPPAPGAVRRPPPRPLPPRPRPQRTQAGNQSACGCSRVRVAGQTVRAWGPIAAAADGTIAIQGLPPPPPGSRPGRRGAGLVDVSGRRRSEPPRALRPPAADAAARTRIHGPTACAVSRQESPPLPIPERAGARRHGDRSRTLENTRAASHPALTAGGPAAAEPREPRGARRAGE